MPHSPFTRLLGAFIVAAYFFFLLWPDERLHLWGWRGLVTAPFIFGYLTWWSVRSAPPEDDRAFHRTLPPGDGYAFWRTIRLHLFVVAGIALAVTVYGLTYNLGWEMISYGAAALAIPVWAWMAACGIAMSLATTSHRWRSLGYLSIFALPIFSSFWVYLISSRYEIDDTHWAWFTPWRTIALASAFLYTLVWWLVAAKHRRRLGALLGGATSMLLPWLYVYGAFMPVDRYSEIPEPPPSLISLERLPMPDVIEPSDDDRIVPYRFMKASGLRAGEYLSPYSLFIGNKRYFLNVVRTPEPLKEALLSLHEITREQRDDLTYVPVYPIFVADSEGRILSDKKAQERMLVSILPQANHFGSWHSETETGSLTTIHKSIREEPPSISLTTSSISADQWYFSTVIYSGVELPSVSAIKGGRLKLPEGGILRLLPLREDGTNFSLSFQINYRSFDQAAGPWWGRDENTNGFTGQPLIVARNSKGEARIIESPIFGERGKNFLMNWDQRDYFTGSTTDPSGKENLEFLQDSRIYILWSSQIGTKEFHLPVPE